MNDEKVLKPIEVVKVVLQVAAQLAEDYEEDNAIDPGEAKDAVFSLLSKLWEEYND